MGCSGILSVQKVDWAAATGMSGNLPCISAGRWVRVHAGVLLV